MNLEHRLQHAARELRELPIEVPPLGSCAPTSARSRLHVLATPALIPMLFVAGALFAIGAMRPDIHRPMHSDIPAAVAADSSGAEPAVATGGEPGAVDVDAPIVEAPSVLDELQMIAALVNERPTPSADATSPPTAEPVDRSAGLIGPI